MLNLILLILRRAKTSPNRYKRFTLPSSEYGSGLSPGLENGIILRERRESMGITIDEVESATKIRHKYLAALEADDWQLLPSEIVGRGFLRNYASYLDLDPNEMIERRRALADAGLARVLRNTSAVTPLPPERRVDYRPKEVELKDEPEGLDEIANQQRRRRRRPFLGWMLLWGLLLVLFLWQARNIGAFFGGVAEGVQSGIASIFEPEPLLVPIPDGRSINVNAVSDGAIISNTAQQASGAVEGQGVAGQGVAGQNAANQSGAGQITVGEVIGNTGSGSENGAAISSNAGNNNAGNANTGNNNAGNANAGNNNAGNANSGNNNAGNNNNVAAQSVAVVPTPVPPTPVPIQPTAVPPTPVPPTPVPIQPTAVPLPPTPVPVPPTPVPPTPVPPPPTPVPLPPTPVPPPPTPVPIPPTPVPAAPVAAAPACPDARSTLTSPGVNATVSGIVNIMGSATHETFQFYKLEFAPGANAAGGYNYFDGTSAQISGGRLGQLNTTALPNGTYTIRLTTVDLTANFPPPCFVTIQVQN